MTNYEYATWVRGFLQLCPTIYLDKKKIQVLKNHLNLVVAVEGELGEKNKLVYDEIAWLQTCDLSTADYNGFKLFLQHTYFDQVA